MKHPIAFTCIIISALAGTLAAQSGFFVSGVSASAGAFNLFRQQSAQAETRAEGITAATGVNFSLGGATAAAAVNRVRFSFFKQELRSPLRYSAASDFNALTLQVQKPFGVITVLASVQGVQTGKRQLANYGVGMVFALRSPFTQAYSLRLSKIRPPAELAVGYSGQLLSFLNPITFTCAEYRYTFSAGEYTAEAGYTNYKNSPETEPWQFTAGGKTEINNYGVTISKAVNKGALTLAASFSQVSSRLTFSTENLRFGGADVPRLTLITAGISGSSPGSGFTAAVNYIAAYGSITGSLESWPFTSVINTLFLNRLYFKGEGRVTCISGSTGGTLAVGPVTLLPNITLLHIVPDMWLRTWEPQFLVFGTANAKHSQVNYRYAGLALVTLTLRAQVLGIAAQAEIGQALPLYSARRPQPASTGTPVGQGGAPAGKVSGGNWLLFALSKPFGS